MAFSMASILGMGTGSADQPETPTRPAAGGLPRSRQRRSRTIFSDTALERLENVFKQNPYPDINLREQLAEEAGVTEARIQVWFQNRRSRSRRSKTKPADRRDSGFASASPSPPQKLEPKKEYTAPVPPVTSPYRYGLQFSYPYLFGCSPLMPSMYPMMPGYSDLGHMIPSSPLFSPGASPTFQRLFEFPSMPMHSTPLRHTESATSTSTSASVVKPQPLRPVPRTSSETSPVTSKFDPSTTSSSERSLSPVVSEDDVDVTSGLGLA